MEEIKYKGIWWLPSQSDKQIPGLLSYTRGEGCYLQIDGCLGDRDTYDLLYGYSNSGERITVQNAFNVNSIRRIGTGLDECRIFANKFFVGAWLHSDTKFNELCFRTNLLDEWVNRSGFDIEQDIQSGSVNINYKRPDPIELFSSKRVKINIVIKAKTPSFNFVQTEAIIRQKAFFEVNFTEANDLDSLHKVMYQLQNFIALATLKPVIPIEIYGYSNQHVEKIGEAEYPKKIEIYFMPIGDSKDYDVFPPNMLFTLGDILNSSQEKLSRWFVRHEELAPVFDLFFSIMYRPPGSQERKFISLIQAVETYHRRTHKNIDLDEDKHDERISSIIKVTPADYKDWLSYRLTYSNEPTLRARLKELFDEFHDILSNFIEKNEFVNLSVNTRNYFTHFDKSLEKKRASGSKLTLLIELVKSLLMLCLLLEAGFPHEEIKKISQKFDINSIKFFKFIQQVHPSESL
jgi:hypothetical protein